MNHTIKTKNGLEEVNLTPLRAIRHKCLDCSCWSAKEVSECQVQDCSLYLFRFGRNPDLQGKGNAVSLQEYQFKKKLTPEIHVNFYDQVNRR
jgi:hypothetical protein